MPSRKPTSGLGVCSPRVMFAAELSRLRTESGLSLRELAEKAGWDHTHLHGMERGKTLGGPEAAEALDTIYGSTPLLMRLWELAQQKAAFKEKYQRYMELEAQATDIELYSGSIVPGLLQTENYARALLWSTPHQEEDEAALEEQLAARISRSELLRRTRSPFFRTILDEAALRRPLLDAVEWRAQLRHLIEMARLPHVTIRVLPFATGLHDLLDGSVALLKLPSGHTAAFVEGSKGGDLVEDPKHIEGRYRLSYDALRDVALSPRDSVAFIQRVMEDSEACEPLTST